MKQNKALWIVLIVFLVALTLFLFIFFGGEKDKYIWYERYQHDEKEPYDLSVIHDLLPSLNPGSKLRDIENHMGREMEEVGKGGGQNYVFIGGGIFMDSLSKENLFEFVAEGNNAIVISRYVPQEIMFRLYDFYCRPDWEYFDELHDTLINLNFFHPSLSVKSGYKARFFRRDEFQPYYWSYVDDGYFCGDSTSTFIPVGFFKSGDSARINFFKVNYGGGAFYFHTNPILFTNIFMLDTSYRKYAEGVFSHLLPGDIYWDERSKGYYPPNLKKKKYPGAHEVGESPLNYLLSQTPLRWGLYAALAMIVFYMAFRARRRQKAIPLLDPNANTSLQFVQSIGRLYFLERNHQKLSIQKFQQFLAFVRNRYRIQTNIQDPETVRKISIKSEISEEEIQKIIKEYTWISNTSIAIRDDELVKFHHLLDNFYKNCK